MLSIAGCQQASAPAPGDAALDPAEQTAQPGDGPETTADLAARAAQALRAGLDPAHRPPGTPASAPAEVYEAPPLPAPDAPAPVRIDAGTAPIQSTPPSGPREQPNPVTGTTQIRQPDTQPESLPAAPLGPGPAPSTASLPSHSAAPGTVSAFRVVDLALCSRIEGFGKYTRLPTARLRFGRPLPLLVYTELDGFVHAPAGGPGEPPQWAIQVGQEVAIYRVSQTQAAPGKPALPDELVRSYREELCRDIAPRKRRDHYLVQRIELPGTLTPGQYTVKVTLRDVHSGEVTEAAASITVEK